MNKSPVISLIIAIVAVGIGACVWVFWIGRAKDSPTVRETGKSAGEDFKQIKDNEIGICGNGDCENTESVDNCPQDCAAEISHNLRPGPVDAKIVFSTDKDSYNIGDDVKITIKNNTDKSIWYWDSRNSVIPLPGLQIFENGIWFDIEGNNPCACNRKCDLLASSWKELKSSATLQDLWDTESDCTAETRKGKYRLLFYFTNREGATPPGNLENLSKVYSNELNLGAAIQPTTPGSNCGNGRCEDSENAHNCMKDCGLTEQLPCVGENDTGLFVEHRDCCAGLQKNWLHRAGSDMDIYACTVCGDGKCMNGEDGKNCPKDCYCGNGQCDPYETDVSCAKDCASECGKAGWSLNMPGDECCAGLVGVPSAWQISKSGFCEINRHTSSPQCIKCGDGICGISENKCNCPQDCDNKTADCSQACKTKGYAYGYCGAWNTRSNDQECIKNEFKTGQTADCAGSTCCCYSCAPEGAEIPEESPQMCCSGLKKVENSLYAYEVGQCWGQGSYVCINCGDGICGKGESKCNCPQDCKEYPAWPEGVIF